MWRIWNCIPRVLRQHFHGPRASAGVCVEEERAELDPERCSRSNGEVCCHRPPDDLDKSSLCWRRRQNCGSSNEGNERRRADNDHHSWWHHHHPDFLSFFFGRCQALEAVTWGAAVVLGLQLSRHNLLQQYLEFLKNREKHQRWRTLLLRVAFAMPPDSGISPTMSILPAAETSVQSAQSKKKKKASPASETKASDISEDNKSLEDVMNDFMASCRQYTAMGSTVSGVLAAENGDMSAALKHLQLACQLGHGPAYFNLALCYQMGYGVEKDPKQAARYYCMAVEVGHVQSTFNLALMTMNGEGGVAKDKKRALELMNKAAMQGLAQAQTYLGVYYTEDEDNQQDYEQAASYFQAAADQNDAEGQYFLGICYENGWGVESSDVQAAQMYAAAAQSGHDGALYNLAAFHEHGLGGLKQDMDLAMYLYRQSAKTGNQSAEFRLQEAEARKAISEWHEQNSMEEFCQPVPSPIRRISHSSSPNLTDFVREGLTKLWMGNFGRWASTENVTESAHCDPKPTFILGSYDGGTDFSDHDFRVEMVGYGRVNIPDRCMSGLQRTATMPNLCIVSCP